MYGVETANEWWKWSGMQSPVFWVVKYRNQDPENCGQNHIFRSGFLFVATDGDLVGWTDEVDVNGFGGMPYGKDVEEEMVRWVLDGCNE